MVIESLYQKALFESLEWDIIIILDACRYDVFKELYGEVFDIVKVRSLGSCTIEWFYNTWTDRKYDNVIYVSGNPYISNYTSKLKNWVYCARKHFYKVVDVWDYGFRRIGYCYTVDPRIVYSRAITFSRMFRDKKMIIHFLQPHAPYPFCKELQDYFIENKGTPDMLLWRALRKGEVNPEIAKKGYIENIKWVMEYVFKLLEVFKDKNIIISSDHGECFMENGFVNHPCGVDIDILRSVPLVYIKRR